MASKPYHYLDTKPIQDPNSMQSSLSAIFEPNVLFNDSSTNIPITSSSNSSPECFSNNNSHFLSIKPIQKKFKQNTNKKTINGDIFKATSPHLLNDDDLDIDVEVAAEDQQDIENKHSNHENQISSRLNSSNHSRPRALSDMSRFISPSLSSKSQLQNIPITTPPSSSFRMSLPNLSSFSPPPYICDLPPTRVCKHVTPREEEGKEILPLYDCTIQCEGYLLRKMEFISPTIPAKERSWTRLYVIILGTSCKIYHSEPLDIQSIDKPMRHYSMQKAESGLAADYLKRKHVIRVRMEGEQMLFQAIDQASCVGWIESFQASTNISLPLEERFLPKFMTLPRRRRHRRQVALGDDTTGTTATCTIILSNRSNELRRENLTNLNFNEIQNFSHLYSLNSLINEETSQFTISRNSGFISRSTTFTENLSSQSSSNQYIRSLNRHLPISPYSLSASSPPGYATAITSPSIPWNNPFSSAFINEEMAMRPQTSDGIRYHILRRSNFENDISEINRINSFSDFTIPSTSIGISLDQQDSLDRALALKKSTFIFKLKSLTSRSRTSLIAIFGTNHPTRPKTSTELISTVLDTFSQKKKIKPVQILFKI